MTTFKDASEVKERMRVIIFDGCSDIFVVGGEMDIYPGYFWLIREYDGKKHEEYIYFSILRLVDQSTKQETIDFEKKDYVLIFRDNDKKARCQSLPHQSLGNTMEKQTVLNTTVAIFSNDKYLMTCEIVDGLPTFKSKEFVIHNQ